MYIKKNEVKGLSQQIRQAIDGQKIDFRDNKEGAWSILKNDIHTFATIKDEQFNHVMMEHTLLSEYIENISHQLKTPLASLNIMMEILSDAPPEKQEEFITNIKQVLIQMDWLTTSLLKMARLDNKMIVFIPKMIQLSELLEQALRPLEILLDVREQNVVLSSDITCYCDVKWTVEALTNLIKNASEHSPEQSTLTIEGGQNPIYTFIRIIDEGVGIKREDYHKLFTRFQNDNNKNGYGIGLPLALAIMRSQNGDIDVDLGGKGKGATFTMKFFRQHG